MVAGLPVLGATAVGLPEERGGAVDGVLGLRVRHPREGGQLLHAGVLEVLEGLDTPKPELGPAGVTDLHREVHREALVLRAVLEPVGHDGAGVRAV